MNDLSTWFARQHHGLRTFRELQKKLVDLSKAQPEQAAFCRLLHNITGSYIDEFSEQPLTSETADRTHHKLVEFLKTIDLNGSTERRLSDLNRIARYNLLD